MRVMSIKNSEKGKVVKLAGANPWPHEERVAMILALAGHLVEFIPEEHIKMPDFYLDHTLYEIKSPVSDKVKAIERNITRALVKCPNVVFDSSRMKVRDDQVLRELIKLRRAGKGLKKLLLINKRGMIIDIEALV